MKSDRTTLQPLDDLEEWHSRIDPWGYENNPEDLRRKAILLSELPTRAYAEVLDIGCGQGFVTRDLPGERVTGVDVSAEAIAHAKTLEDERLRFFCSSIFDLGAVSDDRYDLIVITGVLYSQYIGHTLSFVYHEIDNLLKPGGILAVVHIDEWCMARFPYLLLKQHFYPYREYTHRLEIYAK